VDREALRGWHRCRPACDPRGTPHEKALALYEGRLVLLDRALEDWRQDRRRRALAAFDRLEDDKLRLSERFSAIGAEACTPP